MNTSTSKRTVLKFMVLPGIVNNLLGDTTYKGARSITALYLALLGANATVAGIVADFGNHRLRQRHAKAVHPAKIYARSPLQTGADCLRVGGFVLAM